jgi:hypothetical protein
MSESNKPPQNRKPAPKELRNLGNPVFKPAPSERGARGVAKVAAPAQPKTRWQRIRPWLIFVPVVPFVVMMLLYTTVVFGVK